MDLIRQPAVAIATDPFNGRTNGSRPEKRGEIRIAMINSGEFKRLTPEKARPSPNSILPVDDLFLDFPPFARGKDSGQMVKISTSDTED